MIMVNILLEMFSEPLEVWIIFGFCSKMPLDESQGLSAKLLWIHAPRPQNLVEVETSPAKGSQPA